MLSLVACVSTTGPSFIERVQSGTVQSVNVDDPGVVRAVAKARNTLDTFLERVAAKDPAITLPVLMVKLQDGDAVEYLWVASPTATASGFEGIIDNAPRIVRNVRNGQRISFSRSQIIDWMYRDAKTGKMVGNFTGCALLAHESPKDAAEFRKAYLLDCGP